MATDDIGGVWRTIGGRRVFIKNGQDLPTAMRESGKFGKNRNLKKNTESGKIENASQKFTDSKGNEVEFDKPEPKDFKDQLDKAKETQPDKDKWRVDNTSHSVEDYKKDNLFTTKGGSVVAVTPDGDIISVCKNTNDTGASGRSLMEFAVANGGKKLDTYDGNFGFYTKCGFEPVSWCEFNEEYAPSDWRKGVDKPEPIIFFKYTGKKEAITLEEFYAKVKKSADYDEAMNKRDKEVKK